jgi:GT2 family glycosyltransferase
MSTVAIGYVHGEMVHARFMKAVREAEAYEDALVLDEDPGVYVSDGRNRLVRAFLDSGRDWLYMCDTDTVFAPNVIERLTSFGKQAISGLMYVNGQSPFPMMYRRIADTATAFGMFQSIADWPFGECIQVDAVGAGALLVHRDVYLEIEKRFPNPASQWFQCMPMGNIMIGEDITFCMRLADAGFSLFVDTATRVGHLKTRVI